MRNHILAAGLFAAAFSSVQADAAPVCKQDGNGRLAATVVGAGIGAIFGSVIAGRHNGTAGALLGAGAGGLAGNQLAKGDDRCSYAYGYYDEQNRWHANSISADRARGYYDRNNQWVDGAPNGYYDRDNRWVALQGDPSAAGYVDRNGRWVPVAAGGYYAADGQWVDSAVPGHYEGGRWISGSANGHYDAGGRWISGGNASYRDANGNWVTQPGYYDDRGRWVAGQVTGYYDARGRWVSTGPVRGTNASYGANMPRDVRAREDRIADRIQRSYDSGKMDRRDADRARQELASIRHEEQGMRRYNGDLSPRDETYIQKRLDDLNATVRAERDDDNRPS